MRITAGNDCRNYTENLLYTFNVLANMQSIAIHSMHCFVVNLSESD